MWRRTLGITALIALILAVTALIIFTHPEGGKLMVSENHSGNFHLSSAVFGESGTIPDKYTCHGANVSPPLQITGAPSNAKSLALIMHDPDAPAGDWVHWTIWNIAPNTTVIPEKSVPAGAAQGTTSFGSNGYGGPCPPSGTHRYIFELYALNTGLNLPASTTRDQLTRAFNGHIVSRTTLTGLVSAQ